MRETRMITGVIGREILDSRGNPTVQAEVVLSDGSIGRGIAPSGASTGAFEALELRDGDAYRYHGKGVQMAVGHVNKEIVEAILGMDASDLYAVDFAMRAMDGTADKSGFGANAILAVSIAVANAAAASFHQPLYQFLGGVSGNRLPVPMMNILNGGVHAKNNLDFQEFMIVPVSAPTFREALRMGTEVYHSLKAVLEENRLSTAVGDEGGFAPDLADAQEALELLTKAVSRAGYQPGSDVCFAMDAAASELYQPDSAMYCFPGESRTKCGKLLGDVKLANDSEADEMNCPNQTRDGFRNDKGESRNPDLAKDVLDYSAGKKLHATRFSGNDPERDLFDAAARQPDTICAQIVRPTDEMIAYYEKLVTDYPLISIEDPLNEEDWDGWKKITKRLGGRVQLVGDDLFVTNQERLSRGIREHCANSILIKPNQIGTISETIETIKLAKRAGYTAIVSHRSGETEDTTIADLAVALNVGQIKTGAPCRGERTAKYNRLLYMEEEIGAAAVYPGGEAFRADIGGRQ